MCETALNVTQEADKVRVPRTWSGELPRKLSARLSIFYEWEHKFTCIETFSMVESPQFTEL